MKKEVHIDNFVLWVYQDQKADIVIDHGVGLFPAEKAAAGIQHYGVSGDGCFQVEQNALIGARPDFFGQGTAKLHPDAEMTHDILKGKALSHVQRGIILDYGKSGKAPDWLPGERARFVPVLNKRGQLKYIRDDARHKRGCVVTPAMTHEYLQFKRSCYEAWWDALDFFADLLNQRDVLVDHLVLEPSVKKNPWRVENVA